MLKVQDRQYILNHAPKANGSYFELEAHLPQLKDRFGDGILETVTFAVF
ncbi:MAG: hypothetical protein AB4426_29255 [Xenococcaceae cyanobacterium]